MATIYSIVNRKDGKNTTYIGSTTLPIRIRFTRHIGDLRLNRHGNQHLQRAWNKYGEGAFEFSVIELAEDDQVAEREQFWMDKYRKDNIAPLYNSGLDARLPRLGAKNSPEATAKTVAANKGRKHSKEARQKMSEARKGNKYHLGHKHSRESIEKMRRAQLGKTQSPETRMKIGNALRGRKRPPEVVEKVAAARKAVGYKSTRGHLGHKHSEESRLKISNALIGRPMTEDHKKKIGDALRGKKKPDGFSDKIKEAWIKRKSNVA